MLGKGGMGEVYRADDLTLDQPVALKFLPEAVSGYESAMARFKNEVRVARQVSHPNVCRVYDVGEIDGHIFLSMEYVDGEDLGSLLRRIGRLPSDKALEISRKLCAGLAAAHEKGVLHRDLKPSNVMLDSRGQVLLTDFGLAGIADQLTGAEVRNGTPQYMAPEQLSGREVTIRSDIYSLGLVLYELFTGKRPFEAETLADLMRVQAETKPPSISTLVKDIDPAVERVIVRCLDPDPGHRPSSALAVAAALPGGDPLAAALAAGETPSPQMVAAAGEGVGLAPSFAIPLFAAAVLGLAAFYVSSARNSALDQLHPRYSEEVLTQKARDMIQRLGFAEQPADQAGGFEWARSFVDYAKSNDKPAPHWNEILFQQPSLLRFWYRSSPYPLTAVTYHDDLLTPGIVDQESPPPILSGMINLQLDHEGRLLYFERIPPQKLSQAANHQAIDWNPLFASAGLDPAQFQSSEPLWTWLGTSDVRSAWTGVWPESKRPLRVEGAALGGRPVAFSLIGAWTKTDRMPPRDSSVGDRGQVTISIVIALAIGVASWRLIRRNRKGGSGDPQGARRLATFVGAIQMGLWLFHSHLNASIGTYGMFILSWTTAIFYAFVVHAMYLALEPYVRRQWPQTIISWSAVLTGRWKDPIVGRDVLVGTALAVVVSAVLANVSSPGDPPNLGNTYVLQGFRETLAVCFRSIPHGIRDTLMFFFVIFLLRVLLRNRWLASAGFVLLMSAVQYFQSPTMITAVVSLAVYSLVAILVLRFGLLTLAVFIFLNGLFNDTQCTFDTSAWFFSNNLLLLAIVLALATWAFRSSVSGQKLWKQDLLE